MLFSDSTYDFYDVADNMYQFREAFLKQEALTHYDNTTKDAAVAVVSTILSQGIGGIVTYAAGLIFNLALDFYYAINVITLGTYRNMRIGLRGWATINWTDFLRAYTMTLDMKGSIIMPERKKSRPRRTYTTEFKQQIVNLYTGGKRKCDIKREYDIANSLLDRWITQAETSGSFHEKDNRTTEQDELLKLRKENQRLLMENDILKQAALIMGRK